MRAAAGPDHAAEGPLEQHQGPFVRRSHKHKQSCRRNHIDVDTHCTYYRARRASAACSCLNTHSYVKASSDPAASAFNEPLPLTVINAAVGVDRTQCV